MLQKIYNISNISIINTPLMQTPREQILNPKTNRLVYVDGAVGKAIIKQQKITEELQLLKQKRIYEEEQEKKRLSTKNLNTDIKPEYDKLRNHHSHEEARNILKDKYNIVLGDQIVIERTDKYSERFIKGDIKTYCEKQYVRIYSLRNLDLSHIEILKYLLNKYPTHVQYINTSAKLFYNNTKLEIYKHVRSININHQIKKNKIHHEYNVSSKISRFINNNEGYIDDIIEYGLECEKRKEILRNIITTNNYVIIPQCHDYIYYDTTLAYIVHVMANTKLRKEELTLALSEAGLVLRADSILCANYIKSASGNIKSIVNRMCEMKYLFDYQDITEYLMSRHNMEQAEAIILKTHPYPPIFPWLMKKTLEKIYKLPLDTINIICKYAVEKEKHKTLFVKRQSYYNYDDYSDYSDYE
jgi:hypothetical protein